MEKWANRTNRDFSERKRLIMATEHTRKCLSFVMENLGSINEDMRCHFSPTTLVKMKMPYHMVCLWECSETNTLICSWWDVVQPFWKVIGSIYENEKCAGPLTQKEFHYQISNTEKLLLICSRSHIPECYYNITGNIRHGIC